MPGRECLVSSSSFNGCEQVRLYFPPFLVPLGLLLAKLVDLRSAILRSWVFVFGNMAKTLFEAIVFIFVMHPFDVGDRIEIDGNQMVVEEMNILTTVFLRCSLSP